MKLCWLDIRATGEARRAITEESVHQRIDAVVADNPADFADVPPTVRKVLMLDAGLPPGLGNTDIVIVAGDDARITELSQRYPDQEFGKFVEIVDASTLEEGLSGRAESALERPAVPRPDQDSVGDRHRRRCRQRGQHHHHREGRRGGRDHLRRPRASSDGVMMAPAAVGDATALKAADQAPGRSTWSS